MAGQDQLPDDDSNQTRGREENAAEPLDHEDHGGPERYPAVRQDDAVQRGGEDRSFRDGGKPESSVTEGRLGPGADPVEGKR